MTWILIMIVVVNNAVAVETITFDKHFGKENEIRCNEVKATLEQALTSHVHIVCVRN